MSRVHATGPANALRRDPAPLHVPSLQDVAAVSALVISTQLPDRSRRRRFFGFRDGSLAPRDQERFILEDSLQDEGRAGTEVNRTAERRAWFARC